MKLSFKIIAVLAALTVTPAYTGCQQIEKVIGGVSGAVSGPAIPSEVKTLAEATNAATLVTRATAAYVRAGNLTDPQLDKLTASNDAVSAALHRWHDAAQADQSLAAASFNAALSAFNTYRSTLPK